MTDIIIIGTEHFFYKKDIFTDKRQRELDNFTKRLSTLHPTKIAVECPYRYQSLLNTFYQNFTPSALNTKTYLGAMELYNQTVQFFSNNEIFQLGFRLAKKLGHSSVYAVDEDISMSDELLDIIRPHFSNDNQFKKVSEFDQKAAAADTLEQEYLIWNNPEYILADHNCYLPMNKANLGNYEGTQLLLQWYERNLKIYSNLQNLAEGGDRILLIIGASHVKLLNELISADETMNLIDWTQELFLKQ